MKNDYPQRLANAAILTPEQHGGFLEGVPEQLFTDDEKADIRAALESMGAIGLDSIREFVSDDAQAIFDEHMKKNGAKPIRDLSK